MISQYTPYDVSGDIPSTIIGFILGIVIPFIIFGLHYYFKRIQEEMRLKKVFLLDLSKSSQGPIPIGTFIKTENVTIPIKNGVGRPSIGIVVKRGDGVKLCIVPTHGTYRDLVIEGDHSPFILLFAQIVGLSQNGAEVHEEWGKFAFPDSSYVKGKLRKLPDNFLIVKPSFNRDMINAAFASSVMSFPNLFAMVNKILLKDEQQYEMIYTTMTKFLTDRFGFMNKLILSGFNASYEAWDRAQEVRPVIQEVLVRLMGIDLSKMGYTGLSHAYAQGSIDAIGKFIGDIKAQQITLADQFDQVTLDKPTAQMLFNKFEQQNQQLADVSQKMLDIKQNNLENEYQNEPQYAPKPRIDTVNA